MEFVFGLMSKFVLYEYGDSRTDSMFGLASVCIYVDCVFPQFILLADSYCVSRVSPILRICFVVQLLVLLVLSDSV